MKLNGPPLVAVIKQLGRWIGSLVGAAIGEVRPVDIWPPSGPSPGSLMLMRLAAIAAGLVIAVAIVGAGSAPAAPTAPTTNHGALTANVAQSPVGWVPPGFVGLSFELRDIEAYTGTDPTAVNPMLEQLIRNLTPGQQPVIRIAGHSSDRAWYPIANAPTPAGVRYVLTPTWLAVVKALAEGVNGRLILGLNLEENSAEIAAAEANAIVAGIGEPWLDALELGNEPDLYPIVDWYKSNGVGVLGRSSSWDLSDFVREYADIARDLPQVPLAGPDVGTASWLGGMGQFLASEPRVRIATAHLYGPGCRATPVTVAQLFSDTYTRHFASRLEPAVRAAHARGVAFRLDETNDISCGGQAGISDTFASALWSLNELFQLARAGVDGVNVHTSQRTIGRLFSFDQVAGTWEAQVAPSYYGLLAFAQAAPPGSKLLGVSGSVSSGPVHVWATRAPDGTERVVVINLGLGSGQTVLVRAGQSTRPATVEWLSAPSVNATQDVTLGSQNFGSDTTTGQLAGPPVTQPLNDPQGTYRLRMRPASAAIITLPAG
jgi:hypothetical protein